MLGVAMGARVIAVDIAPERLALAKEFGADAVVNSRETDPVKAIKELTHGEGAETTMDCTGLPEPRVAAVQSAATWGRMCFVGEGGAATFDVSRDLIRKQLTLMARGPSAAWASGSARASWPTARSRSAGSSPTISASTRRRLPTSASTPRRPARASSRASGPSARRQDPRHSRQPAPGVLQPVRARAAQSLLPPGRDLDIFELEGIPPYNQDHDKQPPARVVELKARDPRGGRDPVLHSRVQLLDARRAEERDRLGLAALRRQRVAGQAGGGDGRLGGHLGSARAQYHLRQCFVFLNMYPVNQPEVLIASAAQRFNERAS